jgi:hypothetical protein
LDGLLQQPTDSKAPASIDTAAVWLKGTLYKPKQCRLARTVSTHDCHTITLPNDQSSSIENGGGASAESEFCASDDGHGAERWTWNVQDWFRANVERCGSVGASIKQSMQDGEC